MLYEKPTEEKLREVEEAKNILLFLMKIVRNYLLLNLFLPNYLACPRSSYNISSILLLYSKNSFVRLKSLRLGFGSLITISPVIVPGEPDSR